MPKLAFIKLTEIRQNKVALRDVDRDGQGFIDLVQSIRNQGVLAAISVREKTDPEDDKKYELVDGLQRFSASKEVGTGSLDISKDPDGNVVITPKYEKDAAGNDVGVIPAQIIDRSEADVLVAQVIANAQRIETQPVQYAKALVRYLGYNPTMTETELALKVGKTPAWLDKTLRLNKLNDKIKPLVDEGRIPLINAYALAELPNEEQLHWLDKAQTQTGAEFIAQAQKRKKEIRDANRKGENAAAPTFEPTRHLRRKPDLESEADAPTAIPALIRDLGILKDVKTNAAGLMEACIKGAVLALNWSMNYDPKSQDQQREKNAAREKQNVEEKTRRDAERADKKATELAKKTAEAREIADKAKADIAKIPAGEPVTA